ncbi:MAG: hypothetical protein JO130_00600 [Solirubrobacterales bacterium]|nr:hypothetical protein [Solirubrobacterales bacterium]
MTANGLPRLALLLTGFLRQVEATTEPLINHLAAHYNTDVFVATWDVADDARTGPQQSMVNPSPVTTHDVVAMYGEMLGGCVVSSFELYGRTAPEIRARERPFDVLVINPRAKEHNTYWMNRLFAQWYVVRQGLHLIEEHERVHHMEYDLICRTRTDILLEAPLPAWPQDRVLVSHALPGQMPSDRGWIPDWFAIGPGTEMKKLGSLCFAIESLYDRQNIDTTNAENLLLHFAVQQDIPLAIQEVPIQRI